MNHKSIYTKVMDLLEQEETKISVKAWNILDAEGIADIVTNGKVFWFESYVRGNTCPETIRDYLIKFIKRKLGIKYLYEIV